MEISSRKYNTTNNSNKIKNNNKKSKIPRVNMFGDHNKSEKNENNAVNVSKEN